MTRQRNSLATRRAIYDDHGGECRFWLGWVHGEINGAVQSWLRTQARHHPALATSCPKATSWRPCVRNQCRTRSSISSCTHPSQNRASPP